MKLHQLPGEALRQQLGGPGLWLGTGPFSVRIRSRIESVAQGLAELYGQFEVRNSREVFADFHVEINSPGWLRSVVRPQATFSFDGHLPFKPLPRVQAYPMLEWGLNWCVSMHAHQFLIVHAAVLEKNGGAVILPAPPGSGKSTLAAALCLSGWRLLSDELTLIDRQSAQIYPLPRPVSLKNASIPLIKAFSSEAFVNTPCHDTLKGTVAHLRPPRESVRRQHEPAPAAWVIFPKWEAGAATDLTPRSRAQTFMHLADNAFNYSHLGLSGFEVGTRLVQGCDCYDFRYSDLAEAIARFDDLADERADRQARRV